MTYCVGMMLDRGIVFMTDTRTNAGVDNISTFKKLTVWEKPGDRVLTLLSSGNLATTQAVVSLLDERTKSQEEREPSLYRAPSMFQAAQIIADTLHEVISQHKQSGQEAESTFGATLIFGGQIAGGPQRLFMIYPEGNFIEASEDNPFFQIGETKYGRPILVRAYDPSLSFEEAMKLLVVSFDSTSKANLSVAAPYDYHLYEKDSVVAKLQGRINADDPYLATVSDGWGEALKVALDQLPEFQIPK